MIDAVRFANSYNAFWNSVAPMCENFVRRLNLDGVERFQPPLGKSGTDNRALISEFSFSLFCETIREKSNK